MTRRAMVVVCVALAAPACTGGKHSHHTPVSIPAPTNLVATPGFESVSLSWSPVTGATGYELFRVRDDSVPWISESGDPISVTGTTYTVSGLRNWVPPSWRVAAVVGSKSGERSASASATPTAGWLVGFRENVGQLAARYRSDIPGDAPSDTVNNASHAATLGGNGPVVYQLPALAPYTEIGVYKTGATRVTVAATAGHTYKYLGVTANGRWAYWDLSGGAYDVHTNDFAGANDATIMTGCPAAPTFRVSAKGLLVECQIAAGNFAVWASDGVTTHQIVTAAPTAYLLLDYFPEGAILSNAGVLYHAPVDGSSGASQLSPDPLVDQGDTYYTGVVGTADTVFIATKTSDTSPYHLWAVAPDGTTHWGSGRKCGSIPTVFGASSDGRHVLALLPAYNGGAVNKVMRWSVVDDTETPLDFSATSDTEAHFLADDSVVVRANAAKWRFVATGVSTPQTTINNVGATSSFLGTSGPWILFNDQSSVSNLTSVNEDLATLKVITTQLASNPSFTWGIGNTDFAYLDKNGAVQLGTPDGSRAATLDPAASTNLEPSGRTADGREFWITTHAAGGEKDTVSVDATGVVTKILGGATSDAGWYVP